MADITIHGIATWLKNWFYDKTEITGFLNNKANQSDLQTTNSNLSNLSSTVDNKVDKVTGKGLSTEDYTTSEKDKLAGIEAEANKTIVDASLSSTSTNPLQNKAINTALDGKAPTNHSSSATSYGVGTGSNYGHNKIVDNLNQSSNENGTSLSAHQGYVLKGLIDAKSDFSGSYNDLTNVPSSFPPSSHSHSSAEVTESSALANIGTSANATQHTINEALNSKIGELSSFKAIEVVATLPTESAATMGKLYIISEDGAVNVYYTEQIGTGSSATYRWHKMDADILDELSIDWSDIENKPTSFTPSSHTHGYITNNGHLNGNFITDPTYNFPIVADTDDTNKITIGNLLGEYVIQATALSNIGTSANSGQNTVNGAIDTAIGTINTNMTSKGAKVDDVDWSYSENGFVNGVKLVDKTTNANGRIILHLKT